MKKNITLIFGIILLIVSIAYVIAEITINETKLSEERSNILIEYDFKYYTIKDIYNGDNFKRCIYRVDEIKNWTTGEVIDYEVNSFKICSGKYFSDKEEADNWVINKLNKYADMLIRETIEVDKDNIYRIVEEK